MRGLDQSWPYPGDGTTEGKQVRRLLLRSVIPNGSQSQRHMASVAEELACRRETLVSKKATLLIDDDDRNVELALRNGVNAVLCSPKDPTSVERGIDILLGHHGLL